MEGKMEKEDRKNITNVKCVQEKIGVRQSNTMKGKSGALLKEC